MITRILVPTDFSKVANNALQFALKFAQVINAEVFLLHVSDVPVSDAYFTVNAYPKYIKDLEEQARKGFEKLQKKYYKNTAVKFRADTVSGNIYDKIDTFAKKQKIDLIIMGTTGASGFNKVLLGSVTASMVTKSSLPILVIPPLAEYKEFQHIVYATDYNETEFPAISRLVYLAELFKSKVTILHIKSEIDNYFNSEHNFFVKNKKNASFNNWKKVERNDKNAMKGINQFIEATDADLLVLARHNQSFFDKIFHRSLSKQMAYHAYVPLLILTEETDG